MLSLREASVSRPEEELLLSCSRPCEDQETIKRLLEKQIDWAYLLHIAGRHGVTPLLYKHLNAKCPEAIPNRILHQLRGSFRDNAVRNLFLTAELLRLLQLFAANNIQVMPFKGPALTYYLYRDVALRTFEDLDVLIHKRDVSTVSRLLISEGYRPQFQLSDHQERAYVKARHALSFTRTDGSVMVDLHWAIIPPVLRLAPSASRLWQRGETTLLLDREIQTFSPENLLLILCVHGTKHYWVSLSWILDIAFLIFRRDDMNWDEVFDQAAIRGSERMLLLGLFLAQKLLRTDLAEEISKKLEDRPDVAALANQVGANLFQNLDVSSRRLERSMFYLRSMDRSADRLKHCYLELVPTPLEWALLPLPPYLAHFYYLLRPVRLLGKYVLRLIRRISIRRMKSS